MERINTTQKITLSLESLQSLLLNTSGNIQQFKMSIFFQTQQQLKLFQKQIQLLNLQQQELPQDSFSQNQQQQQQQQLSGQKIQIINLKRQNNVIYNKPTYDLPIKYKPTPIHDIKKINTNFQHYQKIDISFAQSIILKQYYSYPIQQISKFNQTQISIIPQKLKFYSNIAGSLQEAVQMVDQLRDKLKIHLIQKYGEQLYHSQVYLEKLKSITVTKIQERYYLHYENDKIDDQIVMQLKNDIIDKMVHRFYEFSSRRICNCSKNNINTLENVDCAKKPKQKNPTVLISKRQNRSFSFIQKLFLKLKKNLFSKYFQKHYNNSVIAQKQVQISSDEIALIFHCQNIDQIKWLQVQLDGEYEKFFYFCVQYNQSQYLEISVQQIENSSSRINLSACSQKLEPFLEKIDKNNHICYSASQGSVWIAVQQEYFKNKKNLKEFIKFLEQIEYCCSILYFLLDQQLPEEQKFISNISKMHPWLNEVKMKNPSSRTFEIFFQKYIIEGKKDQSDLLSNPPTESASDKLNVSLNNSNNNINVSSIINDSSIIQESKYQQNTQNLNQSINNGFTLHNMSKVICYNAKVADYKIYIKQENENFQSSYSQDVNQISKSSSKPNRKFDEKLLEVTNIKYKNYPLFIPKILKPSQSINNDDIVCLFVKQKQLANKKLDSDDIRVYFLQQSKHLRNNGYLINVSKQMINEKQGGIYQVAAKSYHFFKYLKYISD